MDLQLTAFLALGTLPFLLVVFHGFLARLLKWLGADIGPQPAAIVVLLLLNTTIATLVLAFGSAIRSESGADWLYDVGYVVLTANAIWFVYFQVFVNLSLTSLHARLMLQGLWNGSVEPRTLAKEYDSEAMLSARLDRLVKLRQITVEAGTISLDWPFLLWLSYPLYWWRRLIRLAGEQLHLAKVDDS